MWSVSLIVVACKLRHSYAQDLTGIFKVDMKLISILDILFARPSSGETRTCRKARREVGGMRAVQGLCIS